MERMQLCQAWHQGLVVPSPRCFDACVQGRFATRMMAVHYAVRRWALLPVWRRESCRGVLLKRAVCPGNGRPPTSSRRRLLRILVFACGVAAPARLSRCAQACKYLHCALRQCPLLYLMQKLRPPCFLTKSEVLTSVAVPVPGSLRLPGWVPCLVFPPPLPSLPLPSLRGGGLWRGRSLGSVLQQVADVRADSRHLMQGVIP